MGNPGEAPHFDQGTSRVSKQAHPRRASGLRTALAIIELGALGLPACAPAVQPIDTDHPKTPSNTLIIEPALTPQPTVTPRPTETPKPIEKGIVRQHWLLSPLSYDAKEGKDYNSMEVTFAAKNRSNIPRSTLELTYNEAELRLVTSDGFTYPHPSRKGEEGSPPRIYVPPGYTLPYGFSVGVAKNAKDLNAVVTSKSNPQQETTWDLQREFPPPGQAKPVEYFPQNERGLKQLGETIEVDKLALTLHEIAWAQKKQWSRNATQDDWFMGIKFEVENKFGYPKDPHLEFFFAFGGW